MLKHGRRAPSSRWPAADSEAYEGVHMFFEGENPHKTDGCSMTSVSYFGLDLVIVGAFWDVDEGALFLNLHEPSSKGDYCNHRC